MKVRTKPTAIEDLREGDEYISRNGLRWKVDSTRRIVLAEPEGPKFVEVVTSPVGHTDIAGSSFRKANSFGTMFQVVA